MTEPSLRDRLLITLRSKTWRSYRQLCLAACGRATSDSVDKELNRLRKEKLVDFWDSSERRFCLVKCAGLNAAREAWARKQRRAAA
jgi:hypothetical protein